MDNVTPSYQHLKITVLNNLAYLKFFGLGVETDKSKAVELWHKAVSLGQYEAEYHLCHAYADVEQPTFNKSKGIIHCKKAYLIYKDIKDKDSDHEIIFSQIRDYLSPLE